MDSWTIHEFLVEIPISIIMLCLPVRIFRDTWRIPKRRSRYPDDADMMIYSLLWAIAVYMMEKQQNYRHKIIVIDMMQCFYLILFILFTKDCLKTLKNRLTDFVVLPVELLAVFILARLAVIFHDPVQFRLLVFCVGTTYITLMRALCERRRWAPLPVVAMFLALRGVSLGIYGLCLSDVFIVIPNLVGAIVGLLLYPRN